MKVAKDVNVYYDNGLWSSGRCFYLDAKHLIHKANLMDQRKAPKDLVQRKKNEGLIKGYTSKGNKAGYGGKVASFFVAILLGKEIRYCKHHENLSGKSLLNLQKATFLRFSKVVVTPQGKCLYKMVIQVKIRKLLKLLQTKSVLYNLVYPLTVRILILSNMLSIQSRKNQVVIESNIPFPKRVMQSLWKS